MQTIILCLKTNSRNTLWQGQRSPTSLYTELLVFYERKMNFLTQWRNVIGTSLNLPSELFFLVFKKDNF